jgi:hypothetical protein
MPDESKDPVRYMISERPPTITFNGQNYHCQHCFPTHDTKHEIYRYFKSEIEGVASGRDFTLLAVGATGTWKSTTVDSLLNETVKQLISSHESIQ